MAAAAAAAAAVSFSRTVDERRDVNGKLTARHVNESADIKNKQTKTRRPKRRRMNGDEEPQTTTKQRQQQKKTVASPATVVVSGHADTDGMSDKSSADQSGCIPTGSFFGVFPRLHLWWGGGGSSHLQHFLHHLLHLSRSFFFRFFLFCFPLRRPLRNSHFRSHRTGCLRPRMGGGGGFVGPDFSFSFLFL